MSNTKKSLRKLSLVNNASGTTNAPSIHLVPSTSLTTSYNLTLPSSLPTATGQSLISDTTGTLTWGASSAIVSSFTGTTNPITTPTNVTGLSFTQNTNTVSVYVAINATTNIYSIYNLKVYQKGSASNWGCSYDVICDTDDVDPYIQFTVTSAGQIQYIMASVPGFTSVVMMWTTGTSLSSTLTSLALSSQLSVTGLSTLSAINGSTLSLSSTLSATGQASFGAGVTAGWLFGGTVARSGSIGAASNGLMFTISPQTFTDTGTAASSTNANPFSSGYFGVPTLASANTGVTTTTASTLTIAGPPTAGTNTTITNAYALNVQSGLVRVAAPLLSPNHITGRFSIPQTSSQTFISSSPPLTLALVSGNMTLANNNQAAVIPQSGSYAISLNFDISPNTGAITEVLVYVNSNAGSNRLIDRWNGGSVLPDIRFSASVNAGLLQGDLIFVNITTNAAVTVQNSFGRGLTIDLIARTS